MSWVTLFVYGTLQRNEINFPHWMLNARVCSPASSIPTNDGYESDEQEDEVLFVGHARTAERYPLFSNSPAHLNCSPCLLDLPGEGHRIHGEVFLVSPRRLELLHALEGVSAGLYEAKSIDVDVLVDMYNADRQKMGHIIRNILDTTEVSPIDDTQTTTRHQQGKERRSRRRIRSLVYFRMRKFDEAWRTTHTLQRRFSTTQSLKHLQGYDCLPAHMRFSDLTPPCTPKPMVLVILDGVGDVGYPHVFPDCSNGCPSPLAAAVVEDPWLSIITANGVSGMMDPYAPGHACGSDTAHLSMLGYDPKLYYRGRGAFESIGAGMEMTANEDIAFKCNFSVLDETTNAVAFRRCDREFTKEGPVLCDALNGTTVTHDERGDLLEHGPHSVRVRYATEHRCGVVITGAFLSDAITGTDPLTDGLPLVHCQPTCTRHEEASGGEEDSPYARAVYTCRVVMAVSLALKAKLCQHPINAERVAQGKRPANIVLLRGAAMSGSIPSFEQRHGLSGFLVAPTCIIRGLGRCCGLDVVESAGGTGDYHSNILNKAIAVADTFAKQPKPYQFAVLHVKGTDDAGHDADPLQKKAMLLRSAAALRYLWEHMPSGTTIAVTGDHTTICSMEDHATECVPFSMAKIPSCDPAESSSPSTSRGQGLWMPDDAMSFTETDCAMRGALGRFQGSCLVELMKAFHYDVPV